MKNKFFWIVSIILIAGIIIELSGAVITVSESSITEKTKVIVIDPGHGGEDGGAVGVLGDEEKDINLQISLYLKELFLQSGFQVVMTRDGDYAIGNNQLNTVSERKRSDIKKRVEICNNIKPDVILSIHQNYFQDGKYSGAQMFYGIKDGSKTLAESIQLSIAEDIQPNNKRQIKLGEKSIYILNNTESPCVIVECGFISNPQESELLVSKDYQQKMAYSIFCGVNNYFQNNSY